jgi:hemoglobin
METERAAATWQERLGGADALVRIVDLLYALALDDPTLEPVFARVDLDALQRHQARFLGSILGSGDATVGAQMRRAHTGLEITPRQFTAMARHLTIALESAGTSPELVREIAAQVERLRDDIVGW